MTVVKKCSCKHTYQDQAYGEGMRIHNVVKKPRGDSEYRCTVCGSKK